MQRSAYPFLASIAVLLSATDATAQFQHPSPLPDVFVINDSFGKSSATTSSNDLFEDQIVRLADFDDSGYYDGQLETSVFFEFGSSPNKNKNWQIQYVRTTYENGVPTLYFTNGRNGSTGGSYVAQVYRAQDLDGDGFATGTEAQIVVDLEQVLGGTQGCESVCVTPDGTIWAPTDYPGGGLVQRKNGVSKVFIKNQLGPYKVPGKNGNLVTIDTDDFTNCTSYLGNGVLVYSDGFGSAKDEAIHRFIDLNGDGDVADPGEKTCFLNATGANPGLEKNPDFGTVLPSMVVGGTSGSYGWLKELATMDEDGTETYYFGCNSSNTGTFSVNDSGQFINGLIFRGEDKNQDGDVNDAGEVNLYYDGSGAGGLPSQLDKILGIDAFEHSIVVFSLLSGNVAVTILTDLNGDGDANDDGERLDPWNEGITLTPVWNLFFYGVKVGAIERGAFGEPLCRQATYSGTGCATYAGPVPRITAQGDCKVGTQFFEVQVRDAPPSSTAVFFLGNGNTFFGQQLPLGLAALGLPGCTLYQNIANFWYVPVDANGFGKLSFAGGLENPAYSGLKLKTQFVTIDSTLPMAQIGLTRLMTLSIP
ncbi:MAG: hypothetical protein R3F34_13645 [Planctomycetota bacterium]